MSTKPSTTAKPEEQVKPAADDPRAFKPETTDDKTADKGNGFPGPAFEQTEVKPEDLPPAAKVPSPASQVNTSGTSCVGTSGPAVLDSADKAIEEGQEAYAEKQATVHDAAQELADAKRKLQSDADADKRLQ